MVVRLGDCTWSATGREGSADQKERPRAPVAPAREARKVYILLVVDYKQRLTAVTTTAQTNKSQNASRQTATFVSLDPVASKSEDQSKAFTEASWYRSTARRRSDFVAKRRTR